MNDNGFDTVMVRTSYMLKVQISVLMWENFENISVI